MATQINIPRAQISAGETIYNVPPQHTKHGPVRITFDCDGFPNDMDLSFLSIFIERSEDNWNTVLPVMSVRRSGKSRAAPASLYIEARNRDNYLVPWNGRLRVRIVCKAPFVAGFTIDIEEGIDPPPLTPVPNSVAHDGEANLFTVIDFAGNSITAAGKTTAGSNRCGIAHIGWDASGPSSVSSVTWGGTSMGSAVGTVSNGAQCDASLYKLVAPSTSSSDVVATFSDDIRGTLGVSSYNGVDQSAPIQSGSPQSNTAIASGTPSVNVTSATGNMVVDSIFYDSASALSQGAGQTLVGSQKVSGLSDFGGGASYESGAGTTTMSWGTADAWALIAASLVASGGGGSNPFTVTGPFRTLF